MVVTYLSDLFHDTKMSKSLLSRSLSVQSSTHNEHTNNQRNTFRQLSPGDLSFKVLRRENWKLLRKISFAATDQIIHLKTRYSCERPFFYLILVLLSKPVVVTSLARSSWIWTGCVTNHHKQYRDEFTLSPISNVWIFFNQKCLFYQKFFKLTWVWTAFR